MRAQGIHEHETLKTGLRPPSHRAALKIDNYLTGVIPEVPVAVDHFKKVKFGLDENDQFGVCGPTAADNFIRLVSKGLTNKEVAASQAQVFNLYRRSGNPNFDPKTGADDNGVEMQVMLEAIHSGGYGAVKASDVIAFGRINPRDESAIDAAVAIFGGVLWGVTLQASQQAQSSAAGPKTWDYHAPHRVWGGHAVLNGRFVDQDDDVISWDLPISTTPKFRRYQLDEVWVLILRWHLDNPAFLAGVDLEGLKRDYQALTGQAMQVSSAVVKKAEKAEAAATEEDGNATS